MGGEKPTNESPGLVGGLGPGMKGVGRQETHQRVVCDSLVQVEAREGGWGVKNPPTSPKNALVVVVQERGRLGSGKPTNEV